MASYLQLEKLIDILETKKWLATGHARTGHARNRSRLAWEEVASIVNHAGKGKVKSGPQWAKYWKDKKGSIKKKIKALSASQIQTGGEGNEDLQLNALEERVVALIESANLSKNDQCLDVDPLHENELSSGTISPSGHQKSYTTSTQGMLKIISDVSNTIDEPARMEFSSAQTSEAEEQDEDAEPVKQERVEEDNQAQNVATYYASHRPPARKRSVHTPPQRLRRQFHRPQLRPPTSQPRSEIEGMSERILAIEERRVETEHLQAKTQHMLAKSALLQTRTQQMLAESLVNHNRTIHDIGNNLISVLENYLSNKNH